MIGAAAFWIASSDCASVSASPPYGWMSDRLTAFVSRRTGWQTTKASLALLFPACGAWGNRMPSGSSYGSVISRAQFNG